MAVPSKQQGRCVLTQAASLHARSALHMQPMVKQAGQQQAGQHQLLGSRSVTQPLQTVRQRSKGAHEGGTATYAGASRIGRLDTENSSSHFNSHSRHAGVRPVHTKPLDLTVMLSMTLLVTNATTLVVCANLRKMQIMGSFGLRTWDGFLLAQGIYRTAVQQVPEPLQMSKLALQALGRAPTAAAAPQAALPSRGGRPPLPFQRPPSGLQRSCSAAAGAQPNRAISRSYSDPGEAEQEASSALLHDVMQKRAAQWPPAKILAKDHFQPKQYAPCTCCTCCQSLV